MGLDVSAFKQLTIDPDVELDENGDPDDDHFVPWILKPEECSSPYLHGIELDPDEIYAFSDRYDFCMGNSRSCRMWDRALSDMIGITNENRSGKPFIELLDHQGRFIGPTISGKLAKDFRQHLSAAEKYQTTIKPVVYDEAYLRSQACPAGDYTELLKMMNEGAEASRNYFLDTYRNFMTAFEMAQEGGVVAFYC